MIGDTIVVSFCKVILSLYFLKFEIQKETVLIKKIYNCNVPLQKDNEHWEKNYLKKI